VSITENTENKKASWRVIRLENGFRDKNPPFIEFPARYIGKLIEALNAAYKEYLRELEDAGMSSHDIAGIIGVEQTAF
jgi:hypothetical protein